MALTLLSVRLKNLRESRNLTQQDLGTYLNISRQGYSHYENGTMVPDFHVLERLADLYDISIDSLLAPYAKKDCLSGEVAEESLDSQSLQGLTRQEQMVLNLFSQLPPEDKEDFMDLLSIKLHQTRIRRSRTNSKEKEK